MNTKQKRFFYSFLSVQESVNYLLQYKNLHPMTAFKNSESLNKSTNRIPDIVSNQNEMTPSFNLQKDNFIIPPTTETHNPNLENISKKPSSFDEWLEELKRKRKFRGR